MKITYRVIFDKIGLMRYISHLDLMRLFQRALRRTGFPLYLTKGFNPHPVIRVHNALKLGLIGEDLEGEFILEEAINKTEVITSLKDQMPEGIKIKRVEVI